MLRLSFAASRHLAWLLALAHGVGMTAAWIVAWPLWFKTLIAAAVIASGVFHLRRDALLLSPGSVVSALLKGDGSIEVTLRNGAAIPGRQIPGSFVHTWFTTILWRAEGARFSRPIAVLPDSLPAEQFRELRVWLKWRRAEGTDRV